MSRPISPSSVPSKSVRRADALRLGKYRFPLGKPDVRLLRKSKPFWSVLSDYGIFNCILRVPITFPPEKLSRRAALGDVRAGHSRHARNIFALHDPTDR